jgi:hypothetical protein
LDPGGANELVSVTAAGGTTLTVTRGQDGTSAVAHLAGIDVRHAISARDLREPQEHIGATTDVHGLSGGAAVVGTTSTQTLTNKTLTSPTVNSPTIVTPTISSSGFTNATHTHAAASSGGTIAHSALTGLTTGDPHTQYQLESEKAAASGYASLDASTKVPIAQVPTGTTGTTVALGNHTHSYSATHTPDSALTAGASSVNSGGANDTITSNNVDVVSGEKYLVIGTAPNLTSSSGGTNVRTNIYLTVSAGSLAVDQAVALNSDTTGTSTGTQVIDIYTAASTGTVQIALEMEVTGGSVIVIPLSGAVA